VSCTLMDSRPDWKAYALGEMDAGARQTAEAHAASCGACREELASMRFTLDAMSALREEEIPKRIAFVSDKVFEPKWWQAFLNPTFAAACLLAMAILVHAFMVRPANAEMQQAKIDAAVAKAMAAQQAEMMAAFDIYEKQFKQMFIQTNGIVRQ
jgi:anti-sigma factor RsiW